MSHAVRFVPLAFALSLFVPAVAYADMPPAAEPAERASQAIALHALHHANLLEIAEAQDAIPRLHAAADKTFAQMLERDHSEGDRKVESLASAKNVALESLQRTPAEATTDDQVNHLPDAQFDRGFLTAQLQGHERVLGELQSLQPVVTDPQVSALIMQTIPVVQSHIEEASRLLQN